MESLSNLFKKTDIFKQEFDKIFPGKPFNKVNILSYITACTEIVLAESRKKYHDHYLKFINPVFIVDNEIFPVPNLPGDPTIAKLTRPFFDLVQEKTIIPMSLPVRDNLLSGVCLFYGDTFENEKYGLFKTYNLDDIFTEVSIRANEIHDIYYVDGIKELPIGVAQIANDTFLEFSSGLNLASDEEKIMLIKSLILFRSIARVVNTPLVFSFVNNFNQRHSFFDCLLTFISEKPFDEDILLDFAHITEAISLPLANYDYNKSKGISKKTMAKRNSLKTLLVKNFKRV
jgi:hypothetical protein